jgi:hypothetical protein
MDMCDSVNAVLDFAISQEVAANRFYLDMANVVVYSEWTQRTTTETLSRPFGDTEAYYATLGYRFGKWLPHLTFAAIEGEASTVGLPSNGVAVITPPGALPR